MKQYTTFEQTAKLIELGFEKPKSTEVYRDGHYVPFVEQRFVYSIGELFEMLPHVIEFREKRVFYPLCIMPTAGGGWAIFYCNKYDERNDELIDALYDMIINLKEEGVI